MDELQDDLLKVKKGYGVQSSTGAFSDVPEKNVEVIAGYLQLVIDVTNRKKEIDVLKIFKNARLIFSDSYIKQNDVLWKEHVAGTLREPFDGQFESGMQRALKHLPKRDNGDEPALFYNEMQSGKKFLNDLAHQRYEEALKYVKDKYSIEETELSEETFNKICKDLMDRLYAWFLKYCYKET